ncbi:MULTISPECIES: helix-turn-helix domain-containing protein [Rhodococcus]|uniref:helix-turn-helix domain-containing protein n=1 Tax=Rhodococcus TaxID=1827 RepID=UPI0022B2D857|nr:helix-turn-helix transcriptional regulator [Rhodococcus pyridinivorans]MCZ4625201.1 helix-turn-helix transcriptional regulator [Rhodococcus pyridinivorans]MCZ4646280.1 helix-turn-helix transcriptional regulator [Rhodococcus pyridinivorans]MDJ0480761.1 helix-turn-helix transcriptional regulator [Rhodococcus pyridinivorans]MDV7252514.1 helix-turn-helix transcriptional regulator [Rhodococcus pyridinivorans]
MSTEPDPIEGSDTPDDSAGPGDIAVRVVNNAAQDIGAFIRSQREAAQVSLRQLSQLAGVSNPYLSQIERGLRKPSAEVLAQIAKGLRLSAEVLYVRAGILEHRGAESAVRDAVLVDTVLTERQKQVLLDIYDSFCRENQQNTGEARPDHPTDFDEEKTP